MISAKVIADSVNPDGQRLTTLECTFNRYILAEVNTHRVFSRNSASSRAIPVKNVISQVWRNPAVPISWGMNQAGMQARSTLRGWRLWISKRLFNWARIPTLIVVWLLSKTKLHKQVSNRLLEPWVWHTAIISSTDWGNFFAQRLHPDAQPEFQELAYCIKRALDGSTPVPLGWGDWHLPYSGPDLSYDPIEKAKVSAARCARVSYGRHLDRRAWEIDISFADSLASNRHFSPLEHPAAATKGKHANFHGWRQLRSLYHGEDGEGT